MNETPKTADVLLSCWLETATKDLAASAQARIRLEIETHYGEAVEAGVAMGLLADDAKRRAVYELGDAQKAAKEFRKKHLTVKEEELINGLHWSTSRKRLSVHLISAVFVFISILMVAFGKRATFWHAFFFFSTVSGIISVLTSTFPAWLLRHSTIADSSRKLLTIELLGLIGNITACIMFLCSVWHPFPDQRGIFFVLIVGYPRMLIRMARAWRKIRRMPSDWTEPAPPAQTA